MAAELCEVDILNNKRINQRVSAFAVCLALCLLAAAALGGCGQSEYTVGFDANYSGAAAIPSQTVQSRQTVTAPEVARDGYVFLGWFQDADLTQAWNIESDKVKSDMTLYAGWDRDTGDNFSDPGNDVDFSGLTTPDSQEAACQYRAYFRPAMDGSDQPYVGDTMPFYEDGVYYIYYLKESGDSRNHSIYLVTTTDFVNYTEYDDVVLESTPGAQDDWIGTGSVVNVEGTYYLFYTGHTDGPMEYKEKVMVAKGDSPLAFEKVADWDLTPPDELGQKRDFRDPQAYYDPETKTITLTITAAQDGTARILKVHPQRRPPGDHLRRHHLHQSGGRLLEPGVQRHLPHGRHLVHHLLRPGRHPLVCRLRHPLRPLRRAHPGGREAVLRRQARGGR